MKQYCEKPKMATETIVIELPVSSRSAVIVTRDGDYIKEPYEKPKMVTETIGDNGKR